jgi:hypothetical protein
MVDNGDRREVLLLDSPAQGLFMPPMTWGTQYDYSPDAVLLVLASHIYDADDYIHDYDEFLRLTSEPFSTEGQKWKTMLEAGWRSGEISELFDFATLVRKRVQSIFLAQRFILRKKIIRRERLSSSLSGLGVTTGLGG